MPKIMSHNVEIYYEVHGDPENPPLLFCNGLGPTIEFVVKFYMPSFLDRFCCATYDLRGIGDSEAPEEDSEFSILRIAQDGLAVMDDLGWDSAHILGASLGAVVAIKMALIAPDRLRSMALHGGEVGAPNMFQKKYADIFRNRYACFIEPMVLGLTPEELAKKQLSFYGPTDSARGREMIKLYADQHRDPKQPPRLWSLLSAIMPITKNIEDFIKDLPDTAEPDVMAGEKLFDELDRIRTKTLIMRGDDPFFHLDSAKYIFDHIQNAELRLSKTTRHSFSLAPDALVEEADWFCRREAEV